MDKSSMYMIPNDRDIYFAEYKIIDGEIHLNNSNETFLALMDLDMCAIGKKLRDLPIRKLTYDAIKRMLGMPTGSTLYFVRERKNDFWDVTIKVDNNSYICVGNKIENYENVRYASKKPATLRFGRSIEASILLEKQGDDFIIKSLSDYAALLFQAGPGDSIAPLIQKHSQRLESTTIFLESLERNMTASLLDEFLTKAGSSYFYYIVMPINHMDTQNILMLMYLLSEEEYYILQKQSGSLEAKSHLQVGTAWFNCIKKEPIRSDNVFSDLFSGVSHNMDILANSAVYSNATIHGSIFYGELTLYIKNNTMLKHNCCVIPSAGGETALIIVSEEESFNSALVDVCVMLTQREQQITALVAQGYKNAYIANILCIAEGTVKKTLNNIFEKLGISSRIELIKMIYK